MSNETKWTPGPWKVGSVATDERGVSLIEIARGPMSVAWVVLGTKPAPQDVEAGRADARLIAAAPDLYAALAELVARRERACREQGGPLDGSDGRYARARAALRRARGEDVP